VTAAAAGGGCLHRRIERSVVLAVGRAVARIALGDRRVGGAVELRVRSVVGLGVERALRLGEVVVEAGPPAAESQPHEPRRQQPTHRFATMTARRETGQHSEVLLGHTYATPFIARPLSPRRQSGGSSWVPSDRSDFAIRRARLRKKPWSARTRTHRAMRAAVSGSVLSSWALRGQRRATQTTPVARARMAPPSAAHRRVRCPRETPCGRACPA